MDLNIWQKLTLIDKKGDGEKETGHCIWESKKIVGSLSSLLESRNKETKKRLGLVLIKYFISVWTSNNQQRAGKKIHNCWNVLS